MGMFDRVSCQWPIPGPEFQDEEFQTKSLNCLMDRYTITADGRLLKYRTEMVPEEERPYYGTEKWDENDGVNLWRLAGSMRTVETDPEEIPYHGDIYICKASKDPPWQLYEYRVRFTHGRVESVKRIEPAEEGAMSEITEAELALLQLMARIGAPLCRGRWGRLSFVGRQAVSVPFRPECLVDLLLDKLIEDAKTEGKPYGARDYVLTEKGRNVALEKRDDGAVS